MGQEQKIPCEIADELSKIKDGIAHFEGVEPGEHRVVLVYNSYSGEQKVLVGDSEKEQVSSLQVELSQGVPTELVLLTVLVMGSIIVVLALLLLRKNKTRNKFKSRGGNL